MKRLTKESLILWGGILLLVLSASYFFVPAIPSGRDAGEAATLVEIINTELKGVEKPNNFRILCKPRPSTSTILVYSASEHQLQEFVISAAQTAHDQHATKSIDIQFYASEHGDEAVIRSERIQ
jgi:hypothetical protein